MMERLVVDTNVLVAAVCSARGASFVVLRGIVEGSIRPSVSVPLFVEYESTLLDPRVRRMHRLSRDEVTVLLDAIVLRVQAVKLHFLWRPQLSDPDDEMVLETAVNAMARTLLTFNERDFAPAAARFGIEVVTPGAWVLRYRARLDV